MDIAIKKDCKEYDKRYVIVDDNGKIIDDAQGYGYKSKQKAYRAMSYKYKGGKQKKENKERKRKDFFKENPKVETTIDRYIEGYIKEIARGEVEIKDIKGWIDKELGIDLPIEYI